MSVSVTMPALGESVTEGTVTRWLKAVGDHVQADEPLLEVSTDKVDTEIPAPASGTLLEILVPEDAVVAVGSTLAVIGEAGQDSTPTPPAATPPAATPPAPTSPAETPPAGVNASPEPAASTPVAAPAPPAPAPSSAGATPIVLPALGESVTEGTVTRWLRAVGDVVAADEPLLEVSTDKVDTEIPAPASGVLLEITVGEDSVVPVGAQLAVIGEASQVGTATPPAATPPAATPPAPVNTSPEPAASPAAVAPAQPAPAA